VAAGAAVGFDGPLIPVHPRHATVFGRPAVRCLRDLTEPVDLAFVMVPTHAVPDVIDDAAAAGIRHAVVLASCYRELDDAVVDAVLRQLGVIRVTSLEELLSTAGLLGYDRWPRGRRMGVLTASGGACGLIADRASGEDIAIPPFAAQTVAAIKPHLPAFGAARNPLDVTGYVLANRRTTALTAIDHALDAAVADPGLDFVLFCGVTIPDVRPPDERLARLVEERVRWLGERLASAPIPVIPMGTTCVDVSAYARDLLTGHGVHLLGGIDLGLRALGHALRWLEHRPAAVAPLRPRASTPGRAATNRAAATNWAAAANQTATGSWSEAAARDLLAACAVPLVPAELVTSADAAAQAARRLGSPVALKVCSAQITHKSDLGGVALGVHGDAHVRDAYRRVLAAAQTVPGAVVDGVLVTPMRTGGVELLVGVTVDRTFGPVLAVGLGGLWVELLADTSLRVLPVSTDEVKHMLGELRGGPLLRGARGRRPADLDALAQVIRNVADAALSIPDGSLHTLEINPLWVNGDQIEALDVLVVTNGSTNGS
jgi:acetate---CoA ligase (ADP-forming)